MAIILKKKPESQAQARERANKERQRAYDREREHTLFVIKAPNGKLAAQVVALDPDTARRMIMTGTSGFLVDDLDIQAAEEGQRGPNRFLYLHTGAMTPDPEWEA